jgi:polysaccharide biosynthesis protein PslH
LAVPNSLANPVRPNILFLAHRLPYPPDKGDRIRTFHILRHLSQKAAVHLACLTDEPIQSEHVDALHRFCTKIIAIELGSLRWVHALWALATGRTVTEGAFASSSLRGIIRQWTGKVPFHGCLASASSMAPYLRLPELRNVPAVVDLVDVDSQKWFDYAEAGKGPKAWLHRLEGRRLRKLEVDLPSWAKAVTLVSEAEADLYRSFCAPGQVQAVGNGVDLDYFKPRTCTDEQGCVFLGALDYRPNVDGVTWFCHNVWPKVRLSLPDAKVYLVGRRPALAVRRLAELAGVVVVGQVPDVRPYLANAAVAVVPLQIARGVQNKVLESMAMGKATVISPCCLKGIRAQAGNQLMLASSADEWQQTLLHLLANPTLRHKLGTAAREYVVQHHRWDTSLAPLDSLFDLPVSSAPFSEPEPINPSPSLLAAPGSRR